MIVIQKEEGKWIVRPAFIGFIKNNYIRRTLMILFCPIIIAVTTLLNAAIGLFLCMAFIAKGLLESIVAIKPNMQKLWDKPREK